jgi:hypothetical protein
MNNKKICFIICVNNDKYYDEMILYLQRLLLPDFIEAEVVVIKDAISMAAGYNEGMKKSNAKYKIYMHQDCFLLKKDSVKIILELFQKDPEIGLVGLVGCEKIPPSGIWWKAKNKMGRVYHADVPENIYQSIYGDFEEDKIEVQALDGFFLATQYDIVWRDDLFCGWHFYDISQCFEFQRHGYKVVIPKQIDAWVLHASGDKFLGPEYNKFRKIFLDEYIRC